MPPPKCRFLLSSLYIELALGCCTNPNKVHCFGIIFPNLNFVFASICAARPIHIQSDQYRSCSTVKQRRATKNSAVALSSRNNMISHTRGVRGRIKAKQRWFRLLENCVMNGFIIFGIMFVTATWLENSPQSFDVYPVSQSRSVVTSAENPVPR